MNLRIYFSLTLVSLSLLFNYVSATCPGTCACGKWKNGKETSSCKDKGLEIVPEGIPSTTQVLDLTRNRIQTLYNNTFSNLSLINLQKLYMGECHIQDIRHNAFAQLSNLVELDLSFNSISEIPAEAFSGTPALRHLNMKGNPITIIPGAAFTNTPYIVSLDLSNCEVTRVAPEAFQALSSLETLKLNDNKLKELPQETVKGLRTTIHSLEIYGNPWICNCRVLLPLWKLLVKLGVTLPPTPSCKFPIRLDNGQSTELKPEDLGCPPELVPRDKFLEAVEGDNASVVCKFWGEPSPDISWFLDNRQIPTIERRMRVNTERVKNSDETLSNLVISEIKSSDSGFVRCEAVNPAGKVSTNFTLAVKARPPVKSTLTSVHVAGITAGVLILIIIIALVILLVGKFRSNNAPVLPPEKPRKITPSNNIVVCAPNPLQKPPRLTELTSSNSADPDIISNLANGYPVTTMGSSTTPGDYTRVEGDSLYPSGIWDENKSPAKEQILHEHFNPGFIPNESPHRGPSHSTPRRVDNSIDPKAYGYPSDYGLPIPEAEHQHEHLYSPQARVASPISNPSQLYDSRQELALYNSTNDVYGNRLDMYSQNSKANTSIDQLNSMYEMVQVGSPSKDRTMLAHPNLHDSGHQDSSPGIQDNSSLRVSDPTENASVLNTSTEQPWGPAKAGVPMGIPVLPPLPNGTLHRIKPRDSPDEGYQEGTEV